MAIVGMVYLCCMMAGTSSGRFEGWDGSWAGGCNHLKAASPRDPAVAGGWGLGPPLELSAGAAACGLRAAWASSQHGGWKAKHPAHVLQLKKQVCSQGGEQTCCAGWTEGLHADL